MSDSEELVTGEDVPVDAASKLTDAMVEKLTEAVKDIDIFVEPVELDDISAEMSAILKEVVVNDPEFRKIVREKLVATIKNIDPKTAARHAETSMGEAAASLLKSFVSILKPRT